MKSLRFIVPLAIFLVLAGFLAVGLKLDPRKVPSPLIGKAWVLNVWASWCGPCREEHPHIVAFARAKQAPLVGLNYKDSRSDALGWLKEFGNPYDLSLSDLDGRVGIDFGVYGVPETFVIDKGGVIRFKHIGPLTPEVLNSQIVPLLKELNG